MVLRVRNECILYMCGTEAAAVKRQVWQRIFSKYGTTILSFHMLLCQCDLTLLLLTERRSITRLLDLRRKIQEVQIILVYDPNTACDILNTKKI